MLIRISFDPPAGVGRHVADLNVDASVRLGYGTGQGMASDRYFN